MDLYFVNAFWDLMDVISVSLERATGGVRPGDRPDKCSAFLKRAGGEVILTHYPHRPILVSIRLNSDQLPIRIPGILADGEFP